MPVIPFTKYIPPVPVVRALIQDDAGRVLLLQRANTSSGCGGWCLPGGKVDWGQTVAEALAREIMEETTLQLCEAEFFFMQDSLPTESESLHCLNLYFRCRVQGEIVLNPESSAYAWVAAGELGQYEIVFRNDEALFKHYARAVIPIYSVKKN
ncbi:NUDIX domain-containing protein [Oceanidesulfovibrio marinus]|uniref:Nudix hydrolase domain-containing protein n=1 Tax=Oceanidesulfovibrio marinus TaxID=370038 RepID=A0A6P1ZCZ8_9BACT|nr:NUDIX domain-containing protein [Oceanidesulfovibrio marinus]TVM32139.1 hypothetical protein DQK91_16550 [Oceanidesulfovibrio marinus]